MNIRKTAAVLAASAALALAASGTASATVHHDDHGGGVDIGDVLSNNDISVLPVLLCNSDITGIGGNVPILSPEQTGDCTNAPVVGYSGNLSEKQRHDYNDSELGDLLSDNTISAVPTLLCNSDGVGIGGLVPVLSPEQTGDCTNGVVVSERH